MLQNSTAVMLSSIVDLKSYLIPFVNSMPEGFIMIDSNQVIIIANSKCCEMFDYRDSELNGKSLSILIPTMFSTVHSKHIERYFNSPHSRPMGAVGMQLYGLKQNGIHFPIEVSLGSYTAKEGMFAIAFIVDVTKKRQLDDALKQSEERFSRIFQSAPLAMCITNKRNDKFIDVNESFLNITGFSKSDVIGNASFNLESILHADSFKELSGLLIKNYAVHNFEAKLITGSGKNIDVLISIEKISLSTGDSFIIMFSDITDRNLALRQLEIERNFNKAVDETVDALIMVQDIEGKVISFNKECERASGYKLKQVVGKISWKLPFINKEQSQYVKEAFDFLKKNGGTYKHEVYWDTKNGRKLIKWSNTTLKDPDGEVTYIIRTGIDITESKKLEVEVLNAMVRGEEKERIRLAKDLHDGLSPLLSSVRNNLDAINLVKSTTPQKKQKYLLNSINLLQNALDEVRTISKDLMPSSLEDYGLTAALKQLCERIGKANNIKVNFYPSAPLKKFNDLIEIGLYRIAQELINNAIKHSGTDIINVHLIKHKKSIVLSVEDKGKGFFYSEGAGTGLGLKNISSRVRSLNGFLNIDARVKKGTLATIEVPLT